MSCFQPPAPPAVAHVVLGTTPGEVWLARAPRAPLVLPGSPATARVPRCHAPRVSSRQRRADHVPTAVMRTCSAVRRRAVVLHVTRGHSRRGPSPPRLAHNAPHALRGTDATAAVNARRARQVTSVAVAALYVPCVALTPSTVWWARARAYRARRVCPHRAVASPPALRALRALPGFRAMGRVRRRSAIKVNTLRRERRRVWHAEMTIITLTRTVLRVVQLAVRDLTRQVAAVPPTPGAPRVSPGSCVRVEIVSPRAARRGGRAPPGARRASIVALTICTAKRALRLVLRARRAPSPAAVRPTVRRGPPVRRARLAFPATVLVVPRCAVLDSTHPRAATAASTVVPIPSSPRRGQRSARRVALDCTLVVGQAPATVNRVRSARRG